jgi:hypothetical protein
MSIEDVGEVPGKTPATVSWLVRSGVAGKVMAAGAALGMVAAFLPLATVSMQMGGPTQQVTNPMQLMMGPMQQMMGTVSASRTVTVIDDWRGKAIVVGSLAGLAFAWLLYPPGRSPAKWMCWTAVGVGVATGLLAFWLFIDAMRSRGGGDLMGMGSVSSSMGIGAVVALLAGAGMAVGALFKGREERLF